MPNGQYEKRIRYGRDEGITDELFYLSFINQLPSDKIIVGQINGISVISPNELNYEIRIPFQLSLLPSQLTMKLSQKVRILSMKILKPWNIMKTHFPLGLLCLISLDQVKINSNIF